MLPSFKGARPVRILHLQARLQAAITSNKIYTLKFYHAELARLLPSNNLHSYDACA